MVKEKQELYLNTTVVPKYVYTSNVKEKQELYLNPGNTDLPDSSAVLKRNKNCI